MRNQGTMPKDIAIARAIPPLSRPRVAFWLILALLLTLATLVQLGHAITASAMDSDGGYTHVSAGDPSDNDCAPQGGVIAGSHCCSIAGCVAAIADTAAAVSAIDAVTAQVATRVAVAPGRAPSPFFHPPKLIVQA